MDTMVATLWLRQLQKDVTDVEEAGLRRLEDGAKAGGDGDRPDVPETGGGASGGHPSGNDTVDLYHASLVHICGSLRSRKGE